MSTKALTYVRRAPQDQDDDEAADARLPMGAEELAELDARFQLTVLDLPEDHPLVELARHCPCVPRSKLDGDA